MAIESSSDINWCAHCHIPFLGKACGICSQEGRFYRKTMKPIFPEEADLFLQNVKSEKHIDKNSLQSKLLFRSRNIILDDKGVIGKISVPKPETLEVIPNQKRQDLNFRTILAPSPHILNWDQSTPFEKKLVQASLPYLQELEDEAISFIRNEIGPKYPQGDYHYFISFSGGKDSTVVSYLVKKAFPDKKIPLLFINTTIEMPQTLDFVRDFARWLDFPLQEVRNTTEFLKLCEELGPPSRMMRWCCTTQKGAPVNEFYKKYGIDGQILSFDGIRTDESNLRKSYPRVKPNTKMTKQLSVYPILEWSEFIVWLYILWRQIPFNPAYRFGYSRIGCWACPNNTSFDWVLSKHAIPDLYNDWKKLLVEFAGDNAKDEEWVTSGAWKSRKSKYNFEPVVSKTSPCALGNDVLYSFDDPISPQFVEFMKIFGQVEQKGKIITLDGEYVKGSFSIGGTNFHVKFNTKILPEHYKYRFEVQVRRALNCVTCGGCIGVCLQNAISINPEYKIDEHKCIQCMTCATSKVLKQSCVALHYNPMRKTIQNPFEFHHITPGKNPFQKLFGFSPKLARKLERLAIMDMNEFSQMELEILVEKTGLDDSVIARGKTIVDSFLRSTVIPFRDSQFQSLVSKYEKNKKLFAWFDFDKIGLKSICYCSVENGIDYENPKYCASDPLKFQDIIYGFKQPTLIIFFEKSPSKMKVLRNFVSKNSKNIMFLNLFEEIRNNFAIPLIRKSKDLVSYFLQAFVKTNSFPPTLNNSSGVEFNSLTRTLPLINLFLQSQKTSKN